VDKLCRKNLDGKIPREFTRRVTLNGSHENMGCRGQKGGFWFYGYKNDTNPHFLPLSPKNLKKSYYNKKVFVISF
jgi:hypothetical protein